VIRGNVIEVRTPVVGAVVDILVQPGTQVTEDDDLLFPESMTMHIPVHAPRAEIVQEVRVNVGDTVHEDDLLVVLS